MYDSLPTSIKSNITRSITRAFKEYMGEIEWQEDHFKMESFMKKWQESSNQPTSWTTEISGTIKEDPEFLEKMAKKINQTIDKILNEPPNEDLIAQIEIMQEQLNTCYVYSCKAEAVYIKEKLNNIKNTKLK